MISCFESRHVAQNNSVINFAMSLVPCRLMCSVTTYASILIPFPFIICFGPNHKCHQKVNFLFWFGLEVHSENKNSDLVWCCTSPLLVFLNFLFCLSFWPNCLVFIAFSFFFWCHVFNSSSMPDHCCRLNFTRNKFSHCLPKVLSWMAVVLHRVRLPQQQRQPIQLVSCSQ